MTRHQRIDRLMGALMKPKELLGNAMAPPSEDGSTAEGAGGRPVAGPEDRAILEIDPHEIDAGGLRDRLEHDDEDHARLMHSLRQYGQQVPVLVRPHPERDGRYQIVYGRRRVLALRDLGMPVKALVRDLDDRSLVLAQGQENTARRDLSFVEKASFAAQMAEAGYDRKIICDALSIDKTVISRMLQIIERVPSVLVEEIGSAPSVGRDRWSFFADLWDRAPPDADDAVSILNMSDARTSDERFETVLDWLKSRQERANASSEARTPARTREVVRAHDGQRLAELGRSRGTVTVKMKSKGLDGFDDWLAENLAEIHRDWLARRGG